MSRVNAARSACLAVLILLAALPGVAAGRPAGEIVNGRPVRGGEYPFVVSLQDPDKKADNAYASHFCGGSLIDATHVLTAAHCVWTGKRAIEPAKIRVLAGATRLRERTNREGMLLTVARIAVHPKYGQTGSFDVAVITLKQAAQVSGFIALPAPDDRGADRTGTVATIAGWGDTRPTTGGGAFRPSYPRQMRQVDVPVVSDGKCTASYHRAGIRNMNLRAALCAGGEHRDSCYGDSGGPLFTGGSAAPVQIGIVSWGLGCGQMHYPGIYTRLTNPDIAAFIQKELRR